MSKLKHIDCLPARSKNVVRHSGFTLLELLIALSIFALISAMAYGGMNQILVQRQHTELKAEQLKQLQMVFNILHRDFGQLVNRNVRNEYGDEFAALLGSGSMDGVAMTHAGYTNPAGFARSELQRVKYILEDDRLLRYSWRVLDRAPDSEASEQELVKEVKDFSMRYLDQSDQWQENWPPVVQTGQQSGLPRAVEVSLEVGTSGVLTWLFRIPASAYSIAKGAQGAQGFEDDH